MAVVAFALRPSSALARSTTATGAWAALLAVSMQNLCDLGSEIPGLVIAGTVCAAIVVGGAAGHRPRWSLGSWSAAPRAICVGAAVVSVAALALAVRAL